MDAYSVTLTLVYYDYITNAISSNYFVYLQ